MSLWCSLLPKYIFKNAIFSSTSTLSNKGATSFCFFVQTNASSLGGIGDEAIKDFKKAEKGLTFVKQSELEKHSERTNHRQAALYPHIETYTQT